MKEIIRKCTSCGIIFNLLDVPEEYRDYYHCKECKKKIIEELVKKVDEIKKDL